MREVAVYIGVRDGSDVKNWSVMDEKVRCMVCVCMGYICDVQNGCVY